ncbi:MAG: FAD-binding oxidoreductase [Steroidobacteraceae bacterium]
MSEHAKEDEIVSLVRREFLRGASWLAGAVVIGANGAILTACTPKGEEGAAAGVKKIEGVESVLWKDQEGYETARLGSVWVGNKPKRYPTVIVYPKNAEEVSAAVKFAAANKIKVTRRSGGHSWTAPHLQNGTMQINLTSWQDVQVDAATKTAWIQPGLKSGALTAALDPQNLMFTFPHPADVALGGFLLCGGYGRNSRHWGVACSNILEVECVNAKGEIIKANETENPDFYWAARGAGPGFFGIVTRFKLRVFDKPKVIRARTYGYDMKDFDAVMKWTVDVLPKIPSFVESLVFRRRYDEKTNDWSKDDTIVVIAVAMEDDVKKVDDALEVFESCPARKNATFVARNDTATLQEFYDRNTKIEPLGWNYAVDGVWLEADPDKLVPAIKPMFETVPTPRSYIYYALWGPVHPMADMANSLQSRIYVAAHTRWENAADNDKMYAWTTDSIKALEPLSIGSKLNDDSLVRRTFNYFSPAAEARLKELTAKHDPDSLFATFLKVGDPV